jgi:hypothetical protein
LPMWSHKQRDRRSVQVQKVWANWGTATSQEFNQLKTPTKKRAKSSFFTP